MVYCSYTLSYKFYFLLRVYETQPYPERINQILSVLSERTIDYGQYYNNEYYRLFDENNAQVNMHPGTKGLVAETFILGAMIISSRSKANRILS